MLKQLSRHLGASLTVVEFILYARGSHDAYKPVILTIRAILATVDSATSVQESMQEMQKRFNKRQRPEVPPVGSPLH